MRKVISMATSLNIPLQGRKRDISDSAITFFSTHGFHIRRSHLSCGLYVTRGRHKKTNHLVTYSSGTIQQSPIRVQDCYHQSQANFTVRRRSLMLFFILYSYSCPQALLALQSQAFQHLGKSLPIISQLQSIHPSLWLLQTGLQLKPTGPSMVFCDEIVDCTV